MDEKTLGERLIALVRNKYGWRFSKIPVEMLGDLLDKTLNGGDLAVYALLQCWGQENGRFYYNRKAFRELTGIPERTIRVHIQRLEDAKWLSRHKEPANAAHKFPRVVVTLFKAKGKSPAGSGRKVWQKSAGTTGKNLPMEGEASEGDTPSEKEGPSPARAASPASQAPRPSRSRPDISPEVPSGFGTKDRPEEGSEKKREVAPRDAPRQDRVPEILPDTYNAEVVKARKKAKEAEAAARRKKVTWPPKTGPDVYRRWAQEVQARHPKWKVPRGGDVPWGKVGALGKQLLKRFEPDDLLAVMRVAIWDWPAIRGANPYYAQTGIPTLAEIVRFAEQLAGVTETGWINHEHRVSAYKSEFIAKITEDEMIDMTGAADASRGRRRA